MTTSCFGEPATEVPFRGRVGEALGAQGIEIDLIVASQLDVLDPLSAGHDVEGDVQDVVGFMIGTMALEDVEVVVDIADQADPPCQQQHGTDSPGIQALDAIGELVVDVAGGDHRLFAFQLPARFSMRSRILCVDALAAACGCDREHFCGCILAISSV